MLYKSRLDVCPAADCKLGKARTSPSRDCAGQVAQRARLTFLTRTLRPNFSEHANSALWPYGSQAGW